MDTLGQIIIPLLVLLAFRVNTKKALLILPFTMILDLDVFFRYHRLLFHNIFVALFLPLMITLYIYKYKPEYFEYSWIALFYVFTSLILDLGEGIAILYPLTTNFYFFNATMYFQFWNIIPIPDLAVEFGTITAESTVAVGERVGAIETASRYQSMSETSSGLVLTILIAASMYFEKSKTFLITCKELSQDITYTIKNFIIKRIKRNK